MGGEDECWRFNCSASPATTVVGIAGFEAEVCRPHARELCEEGPWEPKHATKR